MSRDVPLLSPLNQPLKDSAVGSSLTPSQHAAPLRHVKSAEAAPQLQVPSHCPGSMHCLTRGARSYVRPPVPLRLRGREPPRPLPAPSCFDQRAAGERSSRRWPGWPSSGAGQRPGGGFGREHPRAGQQEPPSATGTCRQPVREAGRDSRTLPDFPQECQFGFPPQQTQKMKANSVLIANFQGLATTEGRGACLLLSERTGWVQAGQGNHRCDPSDA